MRANLGKSTNNFCNTTYHPDLRGVYRDKCCSGSPPCPRVAVLVILVLVGAPLQVPEPLHGLHPLSVIWVTATYFSYLVLEHHHLT